MAEVSATNYGNTVATSRFGERLVARDGNGELYGELIERYETDVDARLLEISVMENLIVQSPQAGDERVLELLAFEKVIIEGELGDDYRSIVETYPDLPAEMQEIVVSEPTTAEEVDVLAGDGAAEALREDPLAFLAHLSNEESSRILQALQDGYANKQLQALQD